MSATVIVDGVDRSGYLTSSERTDEYCSPGARLTLAFDTEFAVDTWKTVVLYEDGVKTFTGTVSRIESYRSEQRAFNIQAKDTIRRLREYFVVDIHTTSGEGVQHWISTFASMAGCGSVTYTATATNPTPLAGMTMGRMFAYEIIDELLLYAGMDIWCDADGVLNVGLRLAQYFTTGAIAAGDNLSSFDRSRNSEPCRNAAIVYTVLGTAYIQYNQGWEIDSGDVRTMVVSNIYVDNVSAGNALAQRMVAAAGPEHDIKRCILDEVDTDMEVGDRVTYDDGDSNAGSGHVTTVISRNAGSGPVEEMHVVLDERCPKVGAGGVVIDGRDVIIGSYDLGVWRCMNIWDDTPIWYSLNNGLRDALPIYGVPTDGGLKGDWFIRDPYNPNGLAYWLTPYGIYETQSLFPGQENWVMKVPNIVSGVFSPLGNALGDPVSPYETMRIRSTVARQGRYYILVNRPSGSWHSVRKYIIVTNDNFETLDGGKYGLDNYPGAYWTRHYHQQYHPNTDFMRADNAYDYGTYVSHNSWWTGAGINTGGLAAWHKNDHGCSFTGTAAPHSAYSRGPCAWRGIMAQQCSEIPPEQVILTDNRWCSDAYKPVEKTTFYAQPWTYRHGYTPSGLHIPYDQDYISQDYQAGPNIGAFGFSCPRYIWYYPGYYPATDRWYPALYDYLADSYTTINLPWGNANTTCPRHQGALASHSSDRTKMYCFSHGYPSKFAISDDEGASWTQKTDAPVGGGCFSGFPTSSNKMYIGRAKTWPTSDGDRKLICVTWDRGETWHDVGGDLWEKMAACQVRTDGVNWLGASGLVTIAPRYS